ncbi:hypothetical protein HOY82DRAFT_541882 [Tuber indicum]|nr:hypothetical protein HOY82DRAFT_541882 [Tuber indicum]
MCNNYSHFTTFIKLPKPRQIQFGNEATIGTQYAGQVTIGTISLEALYVPQLRISLLSISQLDQLGYTLHFQDGKCYLMYTDHNTIQSCAPSPEREVTFREPFAHRVEGLYHIIRTGIPEYKLPD